MKLTIENFFLRTVFGEDEALRMIKEAGFDGVDYSFHGEKGKALDFGDHIGMAKKTKALLDKYGLSCSQGHAPFELSFGDELNETNENYLNIVKTLEFASIIGCENVVVHAIKVPAGEDFLTLNLKYYKSLIPYAEKFGVKIAVENLLNSIFWMPEKLNKFIEMLNSPVFVSCIDVGHSAIVGLPAENFISGMNKNLIACVHLHDTDNKKDRHWIPFQGEHNWDNILKALADYGFAGDMNLEVIHSFDALPSELYSAMLEYIAKVGRYMIERFNEFKS